MKLTNDKKRKEFLDSWQEWVRWGECEPLGLTVRRIELPDGAYISAAEYAERNRVYGKMRFAILNYLKPAVGFTANSETTNQIADRLKALKEQLKKDGDLSCEADNERLDKAMAPQRTKEPRGTDMNDTCTGMILIGQTVTN